MFISFVCPSATISALRHLIFIRAIEMVLRTYLLTYLLSVVHSAKAVRQNEMTVFTATCFSNVAVMGSLDVRPSVCL